VPVEEQQVAASSVPAAAGETFLVEGTASEPVAGEAVPEPVAVLQVVAVPAVGMAAEIAAGRAVEHRVAAVLKTRVRAAVPAFEVVLTLGAFPAVPAGVGKGLVVPAVAVRRKEAAEEVVPEPVAAYPVAGSCPGEVYPAAAGETPAGYEFPSSACQVPEETVRLLPWVAFA
jgi:hypothetical protein